MFAKLLKMEFRSTWNVLGILCLSLVGAGLLGGLPRIACATVLGGALWQPGSGRFWLSLAAGGALTALSGVIWLLWRRRRRA